MITDQEADFLLETESADADYYIDSKPQSESKNEWGLIETPFHFLSLGAGVQSSCLALMASRGLIGPMPQAAIFADTQAEPSGVYRWLDWLEKQLNFPVHRVTTGSLTDQITSVQTNLNNGMLLRKSIPLFVKNADGSDGKLFRDCTHDFKIVPLIRKQKELASITRGQKEITVTTWIGISSDEVTRMKPSREKWCQHRWPLIEIRMSRGACLEWMKANGYPEPPRSACSYCPFHNNREWSRLKREEPEAFAEAVRVERAIQELHAANRDLPGAIKGVPFLHRSCRPLDTIEFPNDTVGPLEIWGNECSGMCGV